MKRRLKINGFIVFLAVLAAIIFPRIFFRHDSIMLADEMAEILGVAFVLLGQVLRASARGYKSEHSQEGGKLIYAGPYSLIRNPMYLGILLIGTGVVLVLFNWVAAAIFLLIFTARYIPLIFKEEKKLESLFPRDYQEYRRTVPRVLPSPAALLKRDIAEYLPLKLIWLKKELGSILAVLLITFLIE